MAETLVKNPICSKCGEDARPNAQFCFACGGEIVEEAPPEDGKVSSAWFKDDIVEDAAADESDETAEREEPDSTDIEEADEKQDVELLESDREDKEVELPKPDNRIKVRSKTDPEPEEPEEPENDAKLEDLKLKSAAELRKRPKPVRAKRVEIVWKEESDSPNIIFLVFGLGFVALFALAFFLTIYLK